MWRRHAFLSYLFLALLVSFMLHPLVYYNNLVQTVLASADSDKYSQGPISFSVQGATWVGYDDFWNTHYFVIAPRANITITASAPANKTFKDLWGDLTIRSWFGPWYELPVYRDEVSFVEANGTDVDLSASTSIANIDTYEDLIASPEKVGYYARIELGYTNTPGSVSWMHYWGVDLSFSITPTITLLKVNATTIPIGEGVKIYGEYIPRASRISDWDINITKEGGETVSYSLSDFHDWENPGYFYYEFPTTEKTLFHQYSKWELDAGEYTVFANIVNEHYSEIPADLVTDTAQVRFTVTNTTQSSTPPPTESPTGSPTQSPQPDLDFLSVIFDFFVDTLGIPEFLVVPLLVVLGFSVAVALALLVRSVKQHS